MRIVCSNGEHYEKAELPCGCIVYTNLRQVLVNKGCWDQKWMEAQLVKAVDQAMDTNKWTLALLWDRILTHHIDRGMARLTS